MTDWRILLGHRVIIKQTNGIGDLEERCVAEISPMGYIGFQHLPLLQRNVTVWRTSDFYEPVEDLGTIIK